ncbi:MAG: hypothetical protein WHV66_00340 [Anaerolineales bacterium]
MYVWWFCVLSRGIFCLTAAECIRQVQVLTSRLSKLATRRLEISPALFESAVPNESRPALCGVSEKGTKALLGRGVVKNVRRLPASNTQHPAECLKAVQVRRGDLAQSGCKL